MQDIYKPLEEYDEVYRDKFKEVCEATFQELADASGVNIDANRQLCQEINSLNEEHDKVSNKRRNMIILCVVLWLTVAVGVFAVFSPNTFGQWAFVAIAAGVVALLVVLFKVHPTIKELGKTKSDLEEEIKAKTTEGYNQMAPLNRLYDWDVFSRMMVKTVPKLEFDPFFTTKRLADLVKTYDWDESFNSERSIIYSHSGLINGNPFVICRTRKMIWGSKTYYGEKTIHWTTTERGADGKYRTVHHSERLTASVTRPYPEYPEKTWLIYGNTAAPDLIFNREKNKSKYKEGSLSYKIKKYKLEKRSRDLKNDFAMATNDEFEVLFTTTDRNDNQQYFLLFTPLAQESMISLLRDEEIGYGDDFNFHKHKKINIIVADHMQGVSLDMNPRQFYHYDFDQAKQLFADTNARYFKSIYFCLAPLLCVPLYQQMRPASAIYGREMPTESSYWEHEALANFWGDYKFKHPKCATPSILKTTAQRRGGGVVDVTVDAYGYEEIPKVTYVEKRGGDGRYHNIRVEYCDYEPVVGTGTMSLREDLPGEEKDLTPVTRQQHISSKLGLVGGRGVYRRHIVSKVD